MARKTKWPPTGRVTLPREREEAPPTWRNTRPRGNPELHQGDLARSTERLQMLLGR
jgi:hypothetical protein